MLRHRGERGVERQRAQPVRGAIGIERSEHRGRIELHRLDAAHHAGVGRRGQEFVAAAARQRKRAGEREQTQRAPHPRFSSLKKSLPLSSMTMKAGKSSTSMRQIASMPSSGYSSTSTLRMQSCASRAAGPPIEPR